LGRLAVSVWRFGEFIGRVGLLAYAWCHFELLGSVHLLTPHRKMGVASI
jgi:hypothetical protein